MAVKYAEEHHLMTVGGKSYGAERWQFGIRGRSGGLTNAQRQAAADAIADGLSTTFWGSGTDGLLAGWTIDFVKIAEIGTDGKYPDGSVAGLAADSIYVTGVRNIGSVPPQLTNVATLETGVVRGLAHYGRCFLPILEPFVQAADGRLTPAEAEGIATNFAGWLSDVLDISVPGITQWMVYSALKSTDPRAPVGRAVTSIGVGRVVDTMRARRGQLDEDRQSVPLA